MFYISNSESNFNNVATPTSTLFNGLCAFYNFDGDINDSSGNGINLSGTYQPDTAITGLSAAKFTGSGQGLYYSTDLWNVYYPLGSGIPQDYSYAFWYKPTDVSNNSNNTVYGCNYGAMGQMLQQNANKIIAFIGTDLGGWSIRPDGVAKVTSNFTLTVNQWTHIAVVHDSIKQRLSLYINGYLDNFMDYPTMIPFFAGYTGFAIGGSANPSGGAEYGLACSFDAVGLWNRKLTPDEIYQLCYYITQYPFYKINYAIIAGGGGGGPSDGGGGGAGGLVTRFLIPIANKTLKVIVGQGGLGGLYSASMGSSGSNSSITTDYFRTSAVGGGYGGWIATGGVNGGTGDGANGGCGGGASTIRMPGQGITGQGFSGGSGGSGNAGGGGGVGGVGGNASASKGGNGGIGIINPILGSSIGQLINQNYWIGGGGGGLTSTTNPNNVSLGGFGGGGNGGTIISNTSAGSGLKNTGGGGGGGWAADPSFNAYSGSGGSGLVVLSMPLFMYSGDQNITKDGTIPATPDYYIKNINNGYVIIQCLKSLYYTMGYNTNPVNYLPATFNANVLVVAGGGGGGGSYGGGGGAGGYVFQNINFNSNTLYNVVIGQGGSGAASINSAKNGNDSYIYNQYSKPIYVYGGGAGGGPGYPGGNGGSGGGQYCFGGNVGYGTYTQGFSGGYGGYSYNSTYAGGGGGGAGGPGGNGYYSAGGARGAGIINPLQGSFIGQLSSIDGNYWICTGGQGGAIGTNLGSIIQNSGNGGDGSTGNANNGSSGVAVISYQSYYPMISTSNTTMTVVNTGTNPYTFYHNFSTSDVFLTTPTDISNLPNVIYSYPPLAIQYAIVGGGGGGGDGRAGLAGGGGGGGGQILQSYATLSPNTSYTITVGGGGGAGTSGGYSAISGIGTAYGGGHGGGTGGDAVTGGSGGGGYGLANHHASGNSNGTGTFSGGSGSDSSNGVLGYGGGGGGAGGGGTNASTTQPGSGGANSGLIDGGFCGGGGDGGGPNTGQAASAPANSGRGGGGGSGNTAYLTGGSGGSGRVVIKYAGLPVATGGSISQSGGYTTHTFYYPGGTFKTF